MKIITHEIERRLNERPKCDESEECVVTFEIFQSDRMKEERKKKYSDTIEVKTKIEEKKEIFYDSSTEFLVFLNKKELVKK